MKRVKRDQRLTFDFLLVALLVSLAGCASVQPWKKGRLADRTLLFNGEKLDAVVGTEVLPSREGSAGATGGFRGGCGCK